MNAYHILLVEDEEELLSLNTRRLLAEGYQVTGAKTLAQAREALETTPDLIVLDILMPDGSGLDFCRDLRASSHVPVIFLTNVTGKQQIVAGLRMGGDDYLEKPFDPAELLARMEALLRRVALLQESGAALTAGNLTLDLIRHKAAVDGKNLPLTPKEFQLLAILLRNRNRYASSEELYVGVWGMAACDSRTVAAHISHLRLALRQGGANFTIEHQRLRGYRLRKKMET